MYLAGTPVLAAARSRSRAQHLPLRLTAVFGREHEGLAPDFDADGQAYLAAVAESYGLSCEPELLAARRKSPFKDIALPLLRAAEAHGGPVGQIVLAHCTPDSDGRSSVAGYLADAAEGDPLSFALCDQGTTVPFTALRLTAEFVRHGGRARGLVIVLDAGGVPWPTAPDVPVAARDTAVALLMEPADESGGMLLCQTRCADGAAATAELADFLVAARGHFGGPLTLVAGRGVTGGAALAGADTVVPGDLRDLACASLWWALRDVLPAGGVTPGTGTTVVAEHDPVLGYLCALALPGTAP